MNEGDDGERGGWWTSDRGSKVCSPAGVGPGWWIAGGGAGAGTGGWWAGAGVGEW